MLGLFRSALRSRGRSVSFYRHGESEPYHTARALVGGVGSRMSVPEPSERGETSATRRVLYLEADALLPQPPDGYVLIGGTKCLVERVDSPDAAGLVRAVLRDAAPYSAAREGSA